MRTNTFFGIFLSLFIFIFCWLATAQEYIIYEIKKGDTFFSLSRKFNVEIWEIQKENNITQLKTGQKIKIPSRKIKTHVVQKGETLFSISKKYNVDIEKIMGLNNLENPSIKVGQTLKIPSTQNLLPEEPQTINKTIYIVKKGDTIYSIAKKTGIPVDRLLKVNNMKINDKIYPGKIILLSNSPYPQIPKKNSSLSKRNLSKKPSSYNTSSIYLPIKLYLPTINMLRINFDSAKFARIVVTPNSKVLSVQKGNVTYIGEFGIFGNTVVIKHFDDLYSVYGMVLEPKVKVGQEVNSGDVIGYPSKNLISNEYEIKFSIIYKNKMFAPKNIFEQINISGAKK